MDPIGTITSYFPFIDEDTRNVLEHIMRIATDYYDFIHRLGDFVLQSDAPEMVVYFAIHFSILAYEFPLVEKIGKKYDEYSLLKPNLFMTSAFQGHVEDIDKVHEMTDTILATNQEDWLSLEMYLLKFEATMRNLDEAMFKSSTMEAIRRLIDSNPDFGFYETTLYDYLAIRAHHNGDAEGRFDCLSKGIEIAEKFDDKLRVATLLIRKADLVDRQNRKAILKEAYDIVDKWLGIPVNYADIINRFATLAAIRGEYNHAIEQCQREVVIRERAHLNTGNASLLLSILYNVIGEFESGLEWSLMAEDQFKSRPYLINRAILNQVWSLIHLDRVAEAQTLFDSINQSILKSGDENQLAWLHFVTGIFEMERGHTSLAMSSIEQSLRIYERFGWSYNIQILFLYYMAKIEVHSSDYIYDVISPSLVILEDKAINEDLPGVLGQVLLLKADIANVNGDDSNLREILQQLQTLIEKENLKFLIPYVNNLTRKI